MELPQFPTELSKKLSKENPKKLSKNCQRNTKKTSRRNINWNCRKNFYTYYRKKYERTPMRIAKGILKEIAKQNRQDGPKKLKQKSESVLSNC